MDMGPFLLSLVIPPPPHSPVGCFNYQHNSERLYSHVSTWAGPCVLAQLSFTLL
jgi:hypothetical protein